VQNLLLDGMILVLPLAITYTTQTVLFIYGFMNSVFSKFTVSGNISCFLCGLWATSAGLHIVGIMLQVYSITNPFYSLRSIIAACFILGKKSYNTLITRNVNNHYEGAEFDLYYHEYFSVTEV
jgi:uncharacterized membrane protein